MGSSHGCEGEEFQGRVVEWLAWTFISPWGQTQAFPLPDARWQFLLQEWS